MFFLKEETKVISLHPSYFGPNVREYLITRLNEEEEGRCTGDHFVICVMDMVDIGEGRVMPSSGHAEYTIKYRAIIWKPFRGETVSTETRAFGSQKTDQSLQVDAIVTSVKPTGIFTLAGPLSVFIARKNIPSDIKWEPNTVPPQYTDHADQVIEKGTSLRLKILGVKPDVAAINAIGTIKEDYLG
ncbi:DNA-directed RNA polymerase II 19 kDa polypeptide [Penicillium riverlandense]|uniref:DNA-directed RNA polymerase II 19 kDa polypeptide n=1 Tax=Penicillium riverlandense TaxID=1903569 RepID=UPI002548F1D0|nr:DNA-directed RNA polymerase II 19 kDa polypeptide [Penicillium riverlandense]KAJ5818154.1 DNA-directed RNA polymerase II 19 kDa polypeptide [Penicillium riverlandense]